MVTINPYTILEINPTSNQEEIKQAYRRKAKQYHPDLNKSEDAEKNFILVTEAYELLQKQSPEVIVKIRPKQPPPKKKTKAEKKAEREQMEREMREGLEGILNAQRYARRYDNIVDIALAIVGIGVMYLVYILPSLII